MAEFRELTRIPNGIAAGRLQRHYPDAPPDYVLGTGHVKFFCGRLPWLRKRYTGLYAECRSRGYNVSWVWPEDLDLDGKDYEPTENALALNRARIAERLGAKHGG
jgi:hypothetical protein